MISTLVLFPLLVIAAPPESTTPDLDNVPTPEVKPGDTYKLKPMEVSEARPLPPKTKAEIEREYFYPYQSSMGPRLGLQLNPDKLEEKELIYLLGFYYMLPSISSTHLELGADLQSNRVGTVNGAVKWIQYNTESFRPFLKAGLSLLVEPDKGLANAIDYKQYSLRLGAGIEDLLKDPASLRWDLEFNVSMKEVYGNIVFGYSWGW
jgi:hypothetical protein